MEPTTQLAEAVSNAAADELANAVRKIKHCLAQLSDEQLWWRPSEEMNSVGNLLLHLCGNLRQWIICGIGGEEDRRDRPAEFAQRDGLSKEEMLSQLDATVTEAQAALSRMTVDDLLAGRRIQGFEVSGMQAIFDAVPHFRGHTQEIVHMTRVQLGDDYQFDFVPSTPEQGA